MPSELIEVFCDQCGATGNKIEITIVEPKPRRIGLSELPKEMTQDTHPAVYRPVTRKARCKRCGYEVTWTK